MSKWLVTSHTEIFHEGSFLEIGFFTPEILTHTELKEVRVFVGEYLNAYVLLKFGSSWTYKVTWTPRQHSASMFALIKTASGLLEAGEELEQKLTWGKMPRSYHRHYGLDRELTGSSGTGWLNVECMNWLDAYTADTHRDYFFVVQRVKE